jgi:hypothetical protein
MSHPQAFHTSCRSGLGSQSGFQFNAASPSLDRAVLSRLAAAHAGYHVPRDMPLEPGPADLGRFPVALRVAPVDGAGAVVSRTVYVGREFRGRDGAPDEGRFGNYFSHIVVGNPGDDPFDGLLGIELWDAGHWSDVESSTPELAELGRLQPGPLDFDRVASLLEGVPRELMAAALDAAMEALDGGPRVVLVDADSARAAAWIGWISFALPTADARRLTFTTFGGRPRYADDVHVCVTTPACDIAFGSHEIGSAVRVLEVAAAAPCARLSLYARAALALAQQGTDALATAVRAVSSETDGMRRGARLAIAGPLPELDGDDLPPILDALRELTERGQVGCAATTAKELPADAAIDRAALLSWAALHRAARQQRADEDARIVAETALDRLVPFAGDLPPEIPPVAPDAPTQPTVGNLARWLGAVEAAAGTAASGALIRDGLRLGLVGVNAAVDRRLAPVLVDGLAHTSVQAVLRMISREPPLESILAAMTETLAERAVDHAEAREHLRMVGRYRAARETLERRAGEQPHDFQRQVAWLCVEVDGNPARRRRAAAELAALAAGDDDHSTIRELWGRDGPGDAREHVELLRAYLDSSSQPPFADARRALAELMNHSLEHATAADALGATLARCGQLQFHPSYVAWRAVAAPPTYRGFAEWAARASDALVADERDVPQDRQRELCSCVCREIVRQRRSDDYAEGIAALRSRAARRVDDGLVDILVESLREGRANARLLVDLFERWRELPAIDRSPLVEEVLPRAAEAVKRRDLELAGDHVARRAHKDWETWLERHGRSGVPRVFGRRGRRAREGGTGG